MPEGTEKHIVGRLDPVLSEREELVLRYIVQHFILTANPVGSRYLSKRMEEESVSAATIRNVMADLEEKGYITHPHTSAGRVPTDTGYRLYVDMLIRMEKLTKAECSEINRQINASAPHSLLMKETPRLLATISNQLGIVTAPEILEAVLDRIELVQLSSSRILVILSLQEGLVKTITMEVSEEIERSRVEELVMVLNERLAGLTIREIRTTYRDRLRDIAERDSGNALVRLFLDSGDKIFKQSYDVERVHISPTQNIFHQPEFSSPEGMRGVVELIENEEVVIHLLEGHNVDNESVTVSIGSEMGDVRMADYSLIATRYRLGNTLGTIGLIGPKRMNYSRLITVVGYVAETLSAHLGDK